MTGKKYNKVFRVFEYDRDKMEDEILEISKREQIVDTEFENIFGLKVIVFYCK